MANFIKKQAETCISCEDLSVYKSDKKSNKNEVNDNLLWVKIKSLDKTEISLRYAWATSETSER